MILSTYFSSDGRERTIDQIPRHVHCDLTCLNDLTLAGLGQEIITCYVEVVANDLLHLVYRDIVLLLPYNLFGYAFRKLHGDFLVGQSRVCNQ